MNYELQTNNKGFSLAEAVMAMVVLSIASAGILLPFTSGAAAQAEGVHRTLAVKLAADLMEEIVNTPVGLVISRYGSYTELKRQVKNAEGVVFTDSNYFSFSRSATCEQRTINGVPFILATVRVYYNDREMASVSRLISER